ncbi:MAG: DUF4956 domain-containing protein [Erysipelotrichaceae bacterium]|nr:DUF4956 domain-containing protein [Erysipelotrichaceae bacterium]
MSLFSSIFTSTFTLGQFLIAVLASMVLGFVVSIYYMFRNTYSKSFVPSLILIPAIECVVIVMINGNMGAGIAVAGSFALIRFRSARGSAKDLTAIFMAMAIGIICGTGYIGIAVLFTLIVCAVGMFLSFVKYGECDGQMRYLKITVPENLNYDEAFGEVLDNYCSSYEIEKVKTLSLGSLFRVDYSIVMKDTSKIKAMIDDLRIRNNNLEIVCGKEAVSKEEL